jgi:hypothetical protein
MRFIGGDKAEAIVNPVRNRETSTIPVGTPVALVLDGTRDGLDVVLPATAAAAKAHTLSYGVAKTALPAGQLGNAQAYGFCRQSVMIVRSRSATDANWASTAARAVGVGLKVDTANNAFDYFAAPTSYVTGSAASDTLAMNFDGFMPKAVLAEALASATTVASTAEDTRVYSTSLVKTFLRML